LRHTNLRHLTPGSTAFTLLLGGILSLQLFGMSITLPVLPSIAADFGVGSAEAQLTVSAFLIGIAASQFVYGALSDRYGRKPVLLGGMALYVVASMGCARAPGIGALIGLRALQGFAAAGGSVIARAMVRDLFEGREAVRMMSRFTIITSAVPMVAPLAGGWLLPFTGWRGIFWALALVSLAAMVASTVLLGESIRHRDARATDPRQLLANCWRFARTPGCLAFVFMVGTANGAMFGYSATSSFVFMKVFGVSSANYGWFLTITAVAMLIGSAASERLAVRWSIRQSLTVATTVALLAGLAVLAGTQIATRAGLHGPAGIALLIVPMLCYGFILGMMFSNCIAAALHPLPDIAGVGSAMAGSAQMLGAGFFVWLGGRLFDGTPAAIGYGVALGGTASFLLFFLFGRAHAPGGTRAKA
jgi:DHA1 family bicyclomycin/chloramphenicol resistance-like MFS transporter